MNWLIYIAIAVSAAVARDITQKQALQHEPTEEYLTIRAGMILLLGLPLLPYTDFTFALSGYAVAAIAAGAVSAAIVYRNRGLKHDDVSTVIPLQNLQPVFVTILGWTLLNETLTRQQLLGVGAIAFGTYWLETTTEDHGIIHAVQELWDSRPALYVIFASFLFAISNTLARYVLTNHTNAVTYYFLSFGISGLIVTILTSSEYGLNDLRKTARKHGWEVVPPAALTAIQILSLYQALSLATAGLVIALYRTQSIFTTLQGGWYFNERDLIRRGIAAVITAGGAALVIV